MFFTNARKNLSRRKFLLLLLLFLICFIGIGMSVMKILYTGIFSKKCFSSRVRGCSAFYSADTKEVITSIIPNVKFDCRERCLGGSDHKTEKNIIGTYAEETLSFVCNIRCGIPFAYTRWNDGELDTLTGWKSKTRVRMTQLEGWSTDNNTVNSESLNFDLLESLKVRDPNFLYGFNYPSCGEGLVIQQLSGGGSWKWVSQFSRLKIYPPVNQLTYADLLSGRNYYYFGLKELLFRIANEKNCTVFANKQAKRNKKAPWFDRIYPFDADLTGTWLKKRKKCIRDATTIAKSKSSHIFLIALGPISNILITRMWEANPQNTYVDVGSALNEFHGFGTQARAYMRNPTCQAMGPTCTPMRYMPNLLIGSTDFRKRSVKEIDKLRCCTPIIPNCSLTLERWYPPVKQKGSRRLTCKGILSKAFILDHVENLCRCGGKGSTEAIIDCVATSH